MIKAVIFDCFGVLVGLGFDVTYRMAGGDPVADREFITETLEAANRGSITPTDMMRNICQQLQISPETWSAVVAQSEKPDPQLLAYVQELKKKYKTAILSNANIGTLERKFNHQQLKLFDVVVVSAEVGSVKPAIEIYQLAASKLGVQPNECVFTDDSEGHCHGARQAGMLAIHFRDFLSFKNQLEQLLHHT